MQYKPFQQVFSVRVYKETPSIIHGVQKPVSAFVTNSTSAQEILDNIVISEDEVVDISTVGFIPDKIG